MGSKPNKKMNNQNEISNTPEINNLTRPRSTPICPYNPYSFQTQYNVTINNVLFLVVNPPYNDDTITMADDDLDEV